MRTREAALVVFSQADQRISVDQWPWAYRQRLVMGHFLSLGWDLETPWRIIKSNFSKYVKYLCWQLSLLLICRSCPVGIKVFVF